MKKIKRGLRQEGEKGRKKALKDGKLKSWQKAPEMQRENFHTKLKLNKKTSLFKLLPWKPEIIID